MRGVRMRKRIRHLIMGILMAMVLPTVVWAQDEPITPATDYPFERAEGRDAYENNYALNQVAPIAVGVEVMANFVCLVRKGCIDQDWYVVTLKGGICYTIETDR